MSTSDAEVLGSSSARWRQLSSEWLVILELALIVLVVNVYEIEGAAFSQVMTLAAGGFLVSRVLPLRFRLPFFVLLSIAGIFWVLGPFDGAWLLGLGLVLIGVSSLPWPMLVRVALLVTLGGLLAWLRTGASAVPWSSAVWPILGSMFMFRTVLYLRALSNGQAEKGWWGVLAYFFMLPNVAFPLFPVVDYQTFGRTHFDREAKAIYEQGLLWIARGLVHLVAYRFVYFNVLNDPVDVVALSDLMRYMLGTLLLYLRVSGQFHLIVGVLHLFGFRLPETHKLYYLAHSFTELWRRINIYWTDFMMKMVFYPIYFKVKRRGPVASLVIATCAVFLTTWILHSYQWFWLRGGFPLTGSDIAFWGILGALVIWTAVKELKTPKSPRLAPNAWSWRLGLRAAVTFSMFCLLWSLWSSESIVQWLWLLGALGNPDAAGVLLAAGAFLTILFFGGWEWGAKNASASGWRAIVRSPTVRTLVPLIALLAIAQPTLQRVVPQPVADTLVALQTTNLNARDAARQHRGYYEQLDVRGQLNALNSTIGAPAEWQSPAEAGIIRERSDHLSRDLFPSKSIVWNGKPFSTNEFGMRDRAYTRDKPPGTVRVALLGPSHVMGNGVADSETFEALVEDRLNREFGDGTRRYEILNFGVDGYALPQQFAILVDRVFKFSPDLVIATTYHQGQTMTETYLMKLLRTGAKLPDAVMQGLLDAEGLPQGFEGDVPIPHERARVLARSIGIEPRMPQPEIEARISRIAGRVDDRAIAAIAEVARAHGARVAVLGLDGVIEDAPDTVPNLNSILGAELPLLDLFSIFPADQRPALRVAPWDDHPNARAHELIADELYKRLLPLLVELPVAESNTSTPGGA